MSDNHLSNSILSYENEFDIFLKLAIIMPENSVRGAPKESYYYKRSVGDETVKKPDFFNAKITGYAHDILKLKAKKAKFATLCFHNGSYFYLHLFIK